LRFGQRPVVAVDAVELDGQNVLRQYFQERTMEGFEAMALRFVLIVYMSL